MVYPESLSELIQFYKKLPGIGEKSAERYALATLDQTADEIASFAKGLVDAKNKIQPCQVCGHLTDKEKCDVCLDDARNENLIMVLETSKDAFAFEKIGSFSGKYHILGNLISPMEGIGPDDINISSLVKRLESLKNPEVILALKSSIEGETTMLYIKKILEGKNISVSRLSYGLPMGAEIEYLDAITLDMAIKDRKKIS